MKQAQDPGDGGRRERPTDVVAALAEVDVLLAALEPDLRPENLPGHRVGPVVDRLGSIERRVRGARLVLRKAAADTGAWKAAGARSAAEHMAKQEGISVGQARAELAASEMLADLPTARAAAGSGEISVEKAKAVAEAGAADPQAEAALVRAARRGDLRDTQDAARRAIVRADERDGERSLRVHRRRSLKTWLSVDGEGHGVWNIPAEAHHRFLAALEPYRRQAFADARANGMRLSDEALMADALDMLARDVLLDHDVDGSPGTPTPQSQPDGVDASAPAPAAGPPVGSVEQLFDTAAGGSSAAEPHTTTVRPEPERKPEPAAPTAPPRRRRRRAPTQVNVMVDYDALRRGFVDDGETCEVTGLGPVPVGLVRHLMSDCVLRLVVTGTDVTVVASERRYIPAALRTAVWARDSATCVVPGCHATRGLEVDHCHVDFAERGPTALWNLVLLCKPHHLLKTIGGWQLNGGHDQGWTFTPPNGPPAGDDPP